MNSPHKGQWRRALLFSLICAWINGWVNNREAGDLRRLNAHYDVIVMKWAMMRKAFPCHNAVLGTNPETFKSKCNNLHPIKKLSKISPAKCPFYSNIDELYNMMRGCHTGDFPLLSLSFLKITHKITPWGHHLPPILLTDINQGNTKFWAWIDNYTRNELWNLIAHTCPNFNGGFGKPPLKLGHVWAITYCRELWRQLFIHCPASRTTLVATRFRVAVICPIIQVPHCIRVFFYFVWFVFINHIFSFAKRKLIV